MVWYQGWWNFRQNRKRAQQQTPGGEERKKTPTTMSREKQNAVWNSQLEQSVEEIPIWRQKRSSCNFTFSSQEPQCTQLTFVYRKHCHYAPAWTWHTKILEAPCPSEWSHLFNWSVQKQVNLELGSWSLNLGLSCCCSVDWTILVELCLLHLGLASWMHPPLLYQKKTSETLAIQGWQLHQFSTSAPCVPPSCTLLLLSKSALLPSTSRQPGNFVL